MVINQQDREWELSELSQAYREVTLTHRHACTLFSNYINTDQHSHIIHTHANTICYTNFHITLTPTQPQYRSTVIATIFCTSDWENMTHD